MWWDAVTLDREGDRVILYPGNESHALYSIAKTHKRIFGFGDDECAKDIRWMPTEFVVYETGHILTGNINIYDDKKTLIRENVSYFAYSGDIGNEGNNQEWSGNIIFDPINFNSFYKYQGGFDSIFSGNNKVIDTSMRYLIRSISGVVWFVFFGYLIYNNMIKSSSVNSIYKNIGMFGLQLFVVANLFLTGS
jgi:hypothetical protein